MTLARPDPMWYAECDGPIGDGVKCQGEYPESFTSRREAERRLRADGWRVSHDLDCLCPAHVNAPKEKRR